MDDFSLEVPGTQPPHGESTFLHTSLAFVAFVPRYAAGLGGAYLHFVWCVHGGFKHVTLRTRGKQVI